MGTSELLKQPDRMLGVTCDGLQSWTKMLRHFTKFPLFKGTKSILFHPPPQPIQCRQCWHVVKTKLGELRTP